MLGEILCPHNMSPYLAFHANCECVAAGVPLQAEEVVPFVDQILSPRMDQKAEATVHMAESLSRFIVGVEQFNSPAPPPPQSLPYHFFILKGRAS